MTEDGWSPNIDDALRACENCRWWDNSTVHGQDHQDITGLCRRRPPRINKVTGMAFWPFTEDSDWCGAFDPPHHKEPTDD